MKRLVIMCVAASLTAVAAAAAAAAQEAKDPPRLPSVLPDCEKPDDPQAILVCAERERISPYRLPPAPEGFDPRGPAESVSRERNRLMEAGAAGIGSCSPVGPGGFTGCGTIKFKQRVQQNADIPRRSEERRVSVRAGASERSRPNGF